jgi:hypothetical protein
MILIFGEWRKNAVQAAHVYPQRSYPNMPTSNVDFFQYFLLTLPLGYFDF